MRESQQTNSERWDREHFVAFPQVFFGQHELKPVAQSIKNLTGIRIIFSSFTLANRSESTSRKWPGANKTPAKGNGTKATGWVERYAGTLVRWYANACHCAWESECAVPLTWKSDMEIWHENLTWERLTNSRQNTHANRPYPGVIKYRKKPICILNFDRFTPRSTGRKVRRSQRSRFNDDDDDDDIDHSSRWSSSNNSASAGRVAVA